MKTWPKQLLVTLLETFPTPWMCNVNFRIDVTFEMRTSEYVEICISIDNQNNQREGFYVKRKEGEREQGGGETERERACVCVR